MDVQFKRDESLSIERAHAFLTTPGFLPGHVHVLQVIVIARVGWI